MKRALYNQLIIWKNNPTRKPLLLQGARQVGKTYLVNTFGKNEYTNYIYLNFEQDSNLHNLFTGNLDPHLIISNLSLYIGKKIEREDTLLFFDEIQALPSALTSLKYFYEKWPELNIIAAGSLLGVSVGKGSSFPVGKVNFMTLYPMQFTEYLIAFGEELVVEKLMEAKSLDMFPEIIHDKLLSHLKSYLYLGGMPEVLQSYLTEKDITKARAIQNDILNAYQRDFSKYTEKTQAIRTSELWNSIPNQLAKENKKFKYGDVRKNARSKMYEQTIEWLKNAGLIHLAYNIQSPKIPLAAYADYTKFKIFLLDTGLLGAMLNLTPDIIIKPNELFTEYNGAFIENFVASELVHSENNELYYWTSMSDAEVDFVLQIKNEVYPLEVKSGTSRNLKSIRSYADKYKPKYIFRTSPRSFSQNNEFINVPLYSVILLREIILTKIQ